MNWNAHLALCAKDKYRNLAEEMMANKTYTWEATAKFGKDFNTLPFTNEGMRRVHGIAYVNKERYMFFEYAQKPVAVKVEETDDCFICHFYSQKRSVLTGEFNPLTQIRTDCIIG